MTDDAGTRWTWPRLLLVLSLALNLLLIGGIAGSIFKGHDAAHPGEVRHHRMGGVLSRALPEEDRLAIAREMRRSGAAEEGTRAAYAAIVSAMAGHLRAQRFDRAKLQEQMDLQRALFAERMTLGQSLLLDHLERMSPEERMAFAERLEEGLQRKKR